jgi:hypothetical protein
MKNYGIKEGYMIRLNVPDFDDTPFKDEFQAEVYERAVSIAVGIEARSIIDLGCGSGFKLMKHFSHLDTIGVDSPQTVEFLKRTYPGRGWMTIGEVFSFFNPSLLICSDVIEHVANPDTILETISRINPTFAILSTPDRNEIKLGTENGPPRNRHHVREWIHDEFVSYLGERFDVVQSFRGTTIVAIVRNR